MSKAIAVVVLAVVALVSGWVGATVAQGQASIGGTHVPELSCTEDEVVAFVAVDTLGCVHVELDTLEGGVYGGGTHRGGQDASTSGAQTEAQPLAQRA